jgi:hypothetical protein
MNNSFGKTHAETKIKELAERTLRFDHPELAQPEIE